MRQEINLKIIAPVASNPKLSFSVLCCAIFVLCSVLGGINWQGQQKIDAVRKDIAIIEEKSLGQQQQLLQTGNISKQQNQLKVLEKQLVNKYQLWSSYKVITEAGKNGFSRHFFHIANLADENLSLYEINIYDRGSSLALKGYSRKAATIPEYINQLKKQQEFTKVKFGDLSIEKIEGHDVMRFSLARKEEQEAELESELDLKPPIDISELMKLPLLGQLNSDPSKSNLLVAGGDR